MSWIDRFLEDRLAQAAANGEFDVPDLAGRPLPDIDRQRPVGWWTERFIARERSADRLAVVNDFRKRSLATFWRTDSVDALTTLVDHTNRELATMNQHLLPDDRVAAFVVDDIIGRWQRLHESSSTR